MNKPNDPRRALGKGLSALLPSRTNINTSASPAPESAAGAAPAPAPAVETPNGLMFLPHEQVHPNPNQPRTVFNPEKLNELAESIRINGILQPLLVRKQADGFEIVAGERRWRAAKLAGLTEVPVVVQDIADDNLLTLALIENIQRDDLNAIETAIAFDRLNRELQLTHEEIGRRTGKERATISNFLRLLRLPADLQKMVAEQRLSMGHARAILALPTEEQQRQAAQRIEAQGLSVRATEKLVQQMSEPPAPVVEPAPKRVDANVRAAEEELERSLGTRVHIVAKNEKKGKIEIEYYSPEELDRLYQQLVAN
jgi:ParB family transcriptional regulator, chromosome partitioning protein